MFSTKASLLLTEQFADGSKSISNQIKDIQFIQKDFLKHIQIFNHTKDVKKLTDILVDLEHTLYYSVYSQNKENLEFLERLFIGLLGHHYQEVRETASIYLNVIYDGIDWQIRGSYKPRIHVVADQFKIEYLLESDQDDNKLILLLNCYSFDGNDQPAFISWHKPIITLFVEEPQNLADKSLRKSISSNSFNNQTKYIIASVDLGAFPRSGFYDWKFVKLLKGGKIASIYSQVRHQFTMSVENLLDQNLKEEYRTKVIQGRFIVHPKNTKDLQIHEIFVDYPDGILDDFSRGSFKKLKENVVSLGKAGVNCLYLMGIHERDYCITEDPKTHIKIVKKKDACPLAIIDRRAVSTLLGGPEEFKSLVKVSKERNVEIVVDCLTRVSGAHSHKRYRNLMLHMIDHEGRRNIAYGTDGRARNYEDTALLNYRKKEAWDLLEKDTREFAAEFKIDGIHLDNGQAWPQIMFSNMEELERKETDGSFAYSEEDIFYGEIVHQNEKGGYWDTKYYYKHKFLFGLYPEVKM